MSCVSISKHDTAVKEAYSRGYKKGYHTSLDLATNALHDILRWNQQQLKALESDKEYDPVWDD